MRILGRILAGLVGLVVALVVLAFFLPREVRVARATTINAPPEVVFPHVNSLKATEAWSPWLERDPQVQLDYSGPEQGVGARLVWVSDHPQVGKGSQEITASVPAERVETMLDFGKQGTARAFFTLQPDQSGTQITWGFKTDLGMNPMARWTGLMFDRWVGSDYEVGLARLKDLVEQ